MMVTWDDREEQTYEEEQVDLCLMTNPYNKEVILKPCSSYIKTEHLFDNLFYKESELINKDSHEDFFFFFFFL